MIDVIGEVAAQSTARADHNAVGNIREAAEAEAEKVVAERPVEETSKKDARAQSEDDTSGFNFMGESNQVVYEKYDKEGKLVLQIPSVHDENV